MMIFKPQERKKVISDIKSREDETQQPDGGVMSRLAWSERPVTLSSRKEGLQLPGVPGMREGPGQVSPQPSMAPTSASIPGAEKSSCATH